MNFTKHKFLSLPSTQQHKKCAELLRSIYDSLRDKDFSLELLSHYNELQRWLGLEVLSGNSDKSIADRYHEHLGFAQVNIRENNLLPKLRTGDRTEGEPPLPIAIYLDHVRSAFNVGSIIRTTEAMALGTLYWSPQTPFIDNRQVQNTAMGTADWVGCYHDVPLEALPKPVIVLDTSPEAICLFDFIFPETFTLVVGNEEYGCSDEALSQADFLIEIPMQGKKNSLNVANAFSIAAIEIRRQVKMRSRCSQFYPEV